MGDKSNILDSKDSQTEFSEFDRKRIESVGEDTEYGDETQSLLAMEERSSYSQIPFGFQSRGSYKHASKNCEIVGVTHNSRFRQFVFLDSRGITSWSYESVYNTVTRHLNYPSYQFNVLRLIIFSRKFNVYFALSKEYALKVFNLNFHEVFSVSAEMHSVLCMVFNHSRDELITGGTGGMKFWTFGEIEKDRQKAWERDSRPMANYGLVLRASYPDMGGSWVKQVELDEAMQRLYCLSERNVVAYDMVGNHLFQIVDAHRGPVTGCVYSKACNFLVTVGTDCDVNVWSRSKSGGKLHTFTGHSKAITKIMLHPENSALVITAAMDGIVKVNSLDFMEEIYSLPVFPEGIYWMHVVSSKLIYCCSNRVIEVFSLNHVCDFWALSRRSVASLSLETCRGKSTRVMAVGNDSSVRLISRKRQNLSTVLPPPPISPLNMVKDVAYSREFNMMYLLIDEQEIWVYYTRTNPATRVESWKLDFIEDIHSHHSQDATTKSRASSPWLSEGHRSPSPNTGDLPSRGPSPLFSRDGTGRESSLSTRKEKVLITCVAILYSPIIMQSVEGQACPDATHFLMAGTQDGRVLFLHMFWKGLKYHQLQANKDAVLELYHDQVMNTLVTKCRHPGIVILIWSLPFLQLLKRVDCDTDLTCFTRMNNLLLCGHKRGYLHLHSLAMDNQELHSNGGEKPTGSKRSPKDHQGAINSVDSNSQLGIFCSASQDGVIKIWDKDKTLLREILMGETLTVASFLNIQGDILIGFKHHIFMISNEKVYPLKDTLSSDLKADSFDDEAFETESDIYEDPSVRFESKKILQPDPTNMENYLVPFPNLQLKTSWFMEGRPPPDLEQQNQQDEEESISFMSDSLSLAPTEVYYSPSTTPRRTSLVSSVAMSERRASTELWELPEFGDSPVSSPPRTPPPEPTPPSTPPPEEESEGEPSEGEENVAEAEQDEGPSCGQCADLLQKDGKKKVSIVPSFRKPGGRMGNISIDSRSLRSAHGGPGYAAPVARRMVVENPEPRAVKPRRTPRPVIKKTKKAKENPEEENTRETENKEQDKSQVDQVTAGVKEEEQNEDAVKDVEDEDVSRRSPNVVNMPLATQRPLIRQDTVDSQSGLGTSSIPHKQQSQQLIQDDEKTPDKESPKEIRGMEEKHVSPSSQKLTDGKELKTQSPGKDSSRTDIEENQTKTKSRLEGYDNEEGRESQQEQRQEKSPKRVSAGPNEAPLMTYVDPHTGEVLERPENEVPNSTEVLEPYDEYGVDDFEDQHAEGGLTSFRSKRTDRGEKSVSFAAPGLDLLRHPRRNQRQLPNYYTSGRDSPTLRSPNNSGMVFKETVVPIYESNRPGDLFSRTSKNAKGVSPLTIFALARSRRENAAKAAIERRHSADGRLRKKQGRTGNASLKGEDGNVDDFELNEDDIARLMDKMDLQSQTDDRESVISLRPPSVRKSDSTLMRWCIGALKKKEREIMFPPKPSRPNSSPSAVKGKSLKQGADDALHRNTLESEKRPKTADTIRSNESRKEEFSMFPYERSPSANQKSKHTRDHKDAASVKARTWRQVSSDEDEDFFDAYRAIRSSVGLQGSDEDYLNSLVSKGYSENERVTDTREIPTVETSDYSGNWQSKTLERAIRLKKQRLERQKTATERRQALESKQKEKWKVSHHSECSQDTLSKPDSVIEFITPPPAATTRTASPLPQRDQPQTRLIKEQEVTNEQPYRLRLNPQSGGLGMTPLARNIKTLKSGEHHVSDIANVLPKPPPSASIPSKCSRYVLVVQPDVRQSQVEATTLEETLLFLRFPKSRVRRRHTSATIPRTVSNRSFHVETSFEM